jgi:hypothetical protein
MFQREILLEPIEDLLGTEGTLVSDSLLVGLREEDHIGVSLWDELGVIQDTVKFAELHF